MSKNSVRTISVKTALQIIAIWTLVALSMATQLYLNTRLTNPGVVWLHIFLKQLPAWYLCALLTMVIIFFYDQYPLDEADWKKNLIKQALLALLILFAFSHLRLWAMAYIVNKDITQFTRYEYLNYYLSQIAWDLAIYILIIISVFANSSSRASRKNERIAAAANLRNKELENLLNTAQLEALKLQLSPHFLFNTLNTINALIRSDEKTKAIQVNTKLGDFLRATLYTDYQFVTLSEELKFLELYLDIELLRFSDRLKIEKEIEKETLDFRIPHFILLPLVENAVKHGIARSSSAKLVIIESRIVEKQLQVVIFNDGPLLPKNWKIENSHGIGLKNVLHRLAKIYNGKSQLSIQNDADEKGVNVSITIPCDE